MSKSLKERLARRQNAPIREQRPKYFIVVEGETEKAYFSDRIFKNAEVDLVTSICGSAANPEDVKKVINSLIDGAKAKGRIRATDPAWIVIDRDNVSDENLSILFDWAHAQKSRHVCLTDPQFEYWLLLHKGDGHGVKTQKECLDQTKVHYPGYAKGKLKPLEFSEVQDAITRARARVASIPECLDDLSGQASSFTCVHFPVESILSTSS